MRIILYTKTGCGWCDDVRDLLDEKNIKFEEKNIFEKPEYFEELIQKSKQTLTPTFDIDGKIIVDTDAEAVEAYLKSRNII
ncbi:MAG: glutaredoxin family protein [Patescibacteria group bacterium]